MPGTTRDCSRHPALSAEFLHGSAEPRSVPCGAAWDAWRLVSLLFATPAAAHAELVSITPANGAQLKTPPTQVQMTFTESVNLIDGGIRLIDEAGADRADTRPDRGRAHRQLADASRSAGWGLRRDMAGGVR